MYRVSVQMMIDNGKDSITADVRVYDTLMEAKREYKEASQIFDKEGYNVILTMQRGSRLIEIRNKGGKKDGLL